MLNNKLARNLLLAGVIGAGAFAVTSAPAAADTFTRCDSYGCYRVHCDYDGDNCRWVYGDSYYNYRRYDYEPSVGLSFGFHN